MSSSSSNDNAAPPPQQEGVSTTYQDEEASQIWETRFEELVYFQKGHGHCRVPVDTSGALGKWVMHLREKYKRFLSEQRYRGQLTRERMDRLNALGFEWSVQPPRTPWEERFQQLQAFHQQHEHTKVTKSNADAPFAEWVQKQRKLLRAGKLSEERVSLLQSIGFQERLVATNKTWEESFEVLLDFRRQHGHARVPKPVKNMPPGDEHSLRVWADRQRTYYHAFYLKKKQCILTKRRIKKLNDVGFDWGSYKTSSTWQERFGELKVYLERNGDCNVPTAYSENPQLGRWVSEQRSNYNKIQKGKKSPLTMERRVALESIGFQWKKPKKSESGGKKKAAPSQASAAAAPAMSLENLKMPANTNSSASTSEMAVGNSVSV